ncbi:MAG: FMN-binding negative transcriptional regulator [Caulobacter sp.]|nr:FMN-binding negative transcriptional regulator [Caulobacter sp.]
MHPARPFHQTDDAILASLVAERGLALIIGVVDGRPVVAHAPVLLEERRLRFHLSRNNALTGPLTTGGASALAVVTGPDAYISPDWYGLDDQVPTWNYLSVEMEGPCARLDDAGAAALLDDLSARFETPLAPKPAWTRHKMSSGRFEALLGGIAAFEMAVARFEGTWKLGQNKSAEVIAGVADALDARPDEGSRAIAALMRQL